MAGVSDANQQPQAMRDGHSDDASPGENHHPWMIMQRYCSIARKTEHAYGHLCVLIYVNVGYW